jgi:sugar lactone lactonase YvrE
LRRRGRHLDCRPERQEKLGRIMHGQPATTNMHGQPATTNIAFGGDDWKTLYFTSRSHLGAVNLKVAGLPVPVGKKQG